MSTPESLAVLSVRDHGPGVPEESLEAIFQPFYRISSDTQELDGNGLGPAVAAEAIHIHHGTICATNRRTKGLEMVIRLPGAFKVAPVNSSFVGPDVTVAS
jgi:signal transduction histidine kinase